MLKKCIDKVKHIFDRFLSANQRVYYAKCCKVSPIEDQWILYQAFDGRGILCNPKAIFDNLRDREEFREYLHIWVLDSMENHKDLITQYAKDPKVIFVERHSKEYMKYLAQAKYLINNSTFPAYFLKREGQIYINTWHGIPLKKMGYDMEDGNFAVANTMRNFLCADYLLSANEYQSKMYWDAYKLKGIWQGTMIETGHARNDAFWKSDAESVYAELEKKGVYLKKGKKVILYAPTWKGTDFSKPREEVDEYLLFIEKMKQNLPTDQYQILVKPHQQVFHAIEGQREIAKQFVPADVDTNTLLSIVDLLITDYSSIYFDFLVTGRPILFYIPDLEEYEDTRGMYSCAERLPGPAAKSIDEIASWILNIAEVRKQYKDVYDENRKWILEHEDGHVCDRIIDAIWHGKEVHTSQIEQPEKKRLLLHMPVLSENGIARSFISLLNAFDYEKYDVTVFVEYPDFIPNNKEKIQTFHKNVRCLVYVPGICGSWKELILKKVMLHNGFSTDREWKRFPKDIFRRDFQRSFGNSRFDAVIDFQGYTPISCCLLLMGNSGKKIIWQHNDMLAERDKVVNGVKPHEKTLNTVFYLYKYFDKIVSCGKYVMKQNLNSPEVYGIREKFSYARNTLDIKRMEKALEEDRIMGQDLFGNARKWPDSTDINFVTMGRMSPEKNHWALIRGFIEFQKKYENVKLHIIGDGPLREELMQEIERKGMKDKIILTGQMDNPFSYMKRCQCFILPSLHEGQPLVLTEARALGLPLIISRFGSIEDSIMENGQYLIGNSEEDIEEGLKAYMEGKVPCYDFSVEQYNQEVFREFEHAINMI